jgi:pimeloyl-ACP methyl ester carboxylesterase
MNFRLFAVMWLFLSAQTLLADEPFARPVNPRVAVVYEEASQTTRITVDAVDGRVALADVWEGIAIARGASQLESESAPNLDVLGALKSLNLKSPMARASLTALTLALAPDVRFELVAANETHAEQLRVTLSRDAVMASERRFKDKLRVSIVDRIRQREAEAALPGLELDEGWSERPIELPLVVAVHGLFSKSDNVARILDLPRKTGLPCAEYSYSSRLPIGELAAALAEQLDRVRREQPERKVALVAHSMGGLVARAAIEDPALDPGNVCRLVMLATPNQGSRLADFNFALGVTNYIGDAERRESVKFFSAVLEDTLGASSYDLRPDSTFLQKLNSRPRHPAAEYTLILGDRGWLSAEERGKMADLVAESEEHGRFARLVRGGVNKLVADMNEVVEGQGDGAVSLERGKLAGVEDVLVFPFGHSEIIGASASEGVVRAHEEVLKRLLE